MDSKSFVLLEHIYDVCGERPFSILDADELCTETIKAEALPKMVELLSGDGYIQLKYADEREYCLGVTQQGKSLVTDVRDERERRKQAAEEAERQKAERQRAEEEKRKAQEKGQAAQSAGEEEQASLSEMAPMRSGGLAPAEITNEEPIETPRKATFGLTKEGKTVLMMWLAAFLGALLGGGIVGLVMYILHVTLK